MSALQWLLLVALLVLIPMMVYAVYLALQLQQQNRQLKEMKQKIKTDRESKLEQSKKSIKILARALVLEELSVTEGCIRIAYLMGQIRNYLSENSDEQIYPVDGHANLPEFGGMSFQELYSEDVSQVFFQVAEATAHIPILDAWGELSRQEQLAYDRERNEIEVNFDEFVRVAAQQLLEQK